MAMCLIQRRQVHISCTSCRGRMVMSFESMSTPLYLLRQHIVCTMYLTTPGRCWTINDDLARHWDTAIILLMRWLCSGLATFGKPSIAKQTSADWLAYTKKTCFIMTATGSAGCLVPPHKPKKNSVSIYKCCGNALCWNTADLSGPADIKLCWHWPQDLTCQHLGTHWHQLAWWQAQKLSLIHI